MKERLIDIENGTVIDHVPAGKTLEVLEALKITGEDGAVISLVMNVPSEKMGKKDIIRIEDKQLNPDDVKRKIAKLAPKATVNWVKDSEVVKKVRF